MPDLNALLSYYTSITAAVQAQSTLVSQRAGLGNVGNVPAMAGTDATRGVVEVASNEYSFVLSAPIGALAPGQGTPNVFSSSIAIVTFSPLAASGSGMAQSVEYTFKPRQAVRQSMAGFQVENFGMAPGRISMDGIMVLSTRNTTMDPNVFTKLLYQSKTTDPTFSSVGTSDPNIPPDLFFFDGNNNWLFKITEENLQLSRISDAPRLLRVRVESTILFDYQQPRPNSVQIAGVSVPAALATTTF
jgi:hypothetical protein